MPRMIDLIRARAVPANILQSAARGALSISQPEMIEILVYLATESAPFGEQACLTLAGWDEKASRAVAASPETPKAVLDYLALPRNFRPALLEALLENPAVSDDALVSLALSVTPELADTILRSQRALGAPKILSALSANARLTSGQSSQVEVKLKALLAEARAADPETESAELPEAELELAAYLTENASEISAENEKPFQPIGGIHEELTPAAEAAVAQQPSPAAAAAKAAPARSARPPASRGSALQRISSLDVTGRIQMAMKGSKEERSLLVRDGTKIVALAVLESPKVSDGEVEKFAAQKNVLEAVLRAITMKRRFMKQYGIIRALVCNPRTPIDVSLTLVKNLLPGDLKNLAGNKEVSETVRKSALRLFKQKQDVKKD